MQSDEKKKGLSIKKQLGLFIKELCCIVYCVVVVFVVVVIVEMLLG